MWIHFSTFSLGVCLLAATAVWAAPGDSKADDRGASQMSMFDKSWVYRAYKDGEEEIRLGQLASTKGQIPQVRALGRRAMDDFARANGQIRTLAGFKDIRLTPGDAKSDSLYKKLNSLDGVDFDTKYLGDIVAAHHASIADFQGESIHGSDPNIRAWAAKTLPTLQQHLQAAQDALSALNHK